MRHSIYKLFFAWDYDKEEKWLNEMSKKGLQLVHPGFLRYVFEENTKDQYVYRLELLNNLPSHPESESYIRFLEDTGAEYVGSLHRWAYFRKNAADGEFELYSDIDSKIRHYKRILFLFFMLMPINVINAANMLHMYIESRLAVSLGLSIFCTFIFCSLGIGVVKILNRISILKKDKYIKE